MRGYVRRAGVSSPIASARSKCRVARSPRMELPEPAWLRLTTEGSRAATSSSVLLDSRAENYVAAEVLTST